MKRPEPTARIAARHAHPRVLAVDYGRRRLGLAVSDALGLTAKPLGTLERRNRREDVRRLRTLVREHEVGQIVVGCPLHLDGRESDMAVEAARFARRLEKELGVLVELADERLTSWEAAQISAEHQGRKRRRRTHDELAAAILLRDYLEQQRARQQGI
ncbi:MAG: Holliday junction resolvase RuvX [Firmicutes bacterium]|nr:Holliday junction resolvase RuvX [Bacillota bacterium]